MEVMLNESSFESEVLKCDKTVLVDFFADWCGPCQMLSPIIKEISEERNDIKVCKLNVDNAPSIAMKYKIVSIPFIAVFKNGVIVNKTLGYQSKEDILKLLGEEKI